ncbi:MAG: hypothetical protein GXX89_03995 [Clostridiales bacterium]|nr:hypothetical protein [Clostridiales bacterium]
MFKEGELVVYEGEGVCKVEDVGPIDHSWAGDISYYTLAPLYRNGRVYTPVNTSSLMRPIISRSEVESIVVMLPSIKPKNCDGLDSRTLESYYREEINSYDCKALMRVLRSIWKRNRACKEQGKRLGAIDTRYKRRAEDMLYGEFAAALGLSREKVREYIEEKAEEYGFC